MKKLEESNTQGSSQAIWNDLKSSSSTNNTPISVKIWVLDKPFDVMTVEFSKYNTVQDFLKMVWEQWKIEYTFDMILLLYPSAVIKNLNLIRQNDILKVVTQQTYDKMTNDNLKLIENIKKTTMENNNPSLFKDAMNTYLSRDIMNYWFPSIVPLECIFKWKLDNDNKKYFETIDSRSYGWFGNPIYNIELIQNSECMPQLSEKKGSNNSIENSANSQSTTKATQEIFRIEKTNPKEVITVESDRSSQKTSITQIDLTKPVKEFIPKTDAYSKGHRKARRGERIIPVLPNLEGQKALSILVNNKLLVNKVDKKRKPTKNNINDSTPKSRGRRKKIKDPPNLPMVGLENLPGLSCSKS